MKDLLYNGAAKLELVTNNTQGTANLKRLALKRRYTVSDNKAREIRLLIGLYEKQALMAEERTARTVEQCRQLISDIVESFFAARQMRIVPLVRDLLKGKSLNRETFAGIVSAEDLNEIGVLARDLLSMELAKRFGITMVRPVLRVESGDLEEYFDAINHWKAAKQKTVLISEQAVKWSSKAWSHAADSMIDGIYTAKGITSPDTGRLLAKAMEIDPSEEHKELFEDMVKRVQGLLSNIELKIINNLYLRTAEVFYSVHDNIAGSYLQQKIAQWEENLSDLAAYKTERA